jgi:hypothetical protein
VFSVRPYCVGGLSPWTEFFFQVNKVNMTCAIIGKIVNVTIDSLFCFDHILNC